MSDCDTCLCIAAQEPMTNIAATVSVPCRTPTRTLS